MFQRRRQQDARAPLDPRQKTLEAWNRTDPDTALPNKLYLLEALERELARLHRTTGECSLLVVEVEPLTRSAGASVDPGWSRAVASRLLLSTRASDIVARIDERHFAALLVGCSARGAAECAERVRTAVSSEPYRPAPDEPAVFLASRVGTATWTPEIEDPERFLLAAFDSLRRWTEAYRGQARQWEGSRHRSA